MEAKVAFRADMRFPDVVAAIDRVEDDIRARVHGSPVVVGVPLLHVWPRGARVSGAGVREGPG